MSEERTGCAGTKERSASRLRAEPPVVDREPVRAVDSYCRQLSGWRDFFCMRAGKAMVPDEVLGTTGWRWADTEIVKDPR